MHDIPELFSTCTYKATKLMRPVPSCQPDKAKFADTMVHLAPLGKSINPCVFQNS